jgi:hypothetical protein
MRDVCLQIFGLENERIILFMEHRKTWGENIKMDVEELGFHEVEWIHLAQYRDYLRSLHDNTLNGDYAPRAGYG